MRFVVVIWFLTLAYTRFGGLVFRWKGSAPVSPGDIASMARCPFWQLMSSGSMSRCKCVGLGKVLNQYGRQV